MFSLSLQGRDHQPQVATEHLRCGRLKLRCAVRLKYTLDAGAYGKEDVEDLRKFYVDNM